LLCEIADLFLQDYPNNIADIRKALDDQNPSLLESAAHNLKGAVGNFDTGPVWQAALTLEKMGRAAEFDGAEEVLSKLNAGLDELRRDLEAFIKSGPYS
jgi:HPt (histidine-containing phosphotransfer) domain-containing protein